MKKRLIPLALAAILALPSAAEGWPSAYQGVMLQGFYWDSFADSKWSTLEAQADELSQYFSLIWVPQSGQATSSTSMGYDPLYYFTQNSSFGTEAELRSMITTFKAKGLDVVADVVVNHRGNVSNWVDFPAETYNGVTYQMQSTDIVADDDDGSTATWAAANGYSLSQNNDEGDGWSGMRDLDHQSDNVQTVVKAYVKYLVDDLGYSGFRYDMVKGFGASHVGDYNDYAGVAYSVGECWDSNSTIKKWISDSGNRSAAFDFQFRYNVRDAINNSNWAALNSTNNLISDADYRQYSVTFIENHDTEKRSSDDQDPILADTLAANAYLLAMPGTPTVFFKHWIDCKQDIKSMIDVRKAAAICNTSTYTLYGTPTATSYGVTVSGEAGNLRVFLGSIAASRSAGTGYTKVLTGYHYAYCLANTLETAWADKASGEYESSVDVLLSAVTASSGAKVVYTTDGTTPSASNGTQVDGGTTITLTESCTLQAALLIGSTVSGMVTRDYTITEPSDDDDETFEPYDIAVYVNADDAGSAWSAAYSTAASPYLNFWSWGGDGSHAPQNSSWPGDKVTTVETQGGVQWFKSTYTMNSASDYVSFVWSVGTGTPQTVDVANITETKYYKISSTLSGSKYTVEDVTGSYTAVKAVVADDDDALSARKKGAYSLSGAFLGRDVDVDALPKGIYIINGKKTIK